MRLLLRSALLAGAAILSPAAWAADPPATEGEQDRSRTDIVVTGAILQDSDSATGLTLTPRETPQSVTIIDRQRIEDFALTNVNDLLNQVVGINVEKVETDRTYFNSRGFDVSSFEVDGIGLPLLWGIQFGDIDTVLFDRVEAVRGANAIMTGIGNPSATINYVRKRPLDGFHASVAGLIGSWEQKRVEADVSVPIADGLALRVVGARDDRDTHLDYNHVDRDVLGAILAWDVSPELTATFGYSYHDNDSDGVLWGALPLTYSDGTRIDYPASASTSADWTYWNVTDQTAFAELEYRLGGWSAKAILTYKRFEEHAKLLYAFGYPDRATGLGVGGMSGIYPSYYDQYLGDFQASGPVRLFGREHELVFGASHSWQDALEYEDFSATFPDYPAVQDWGRVQVAEPSYPGQYLAADYTDKLTRVYGAAHLNFADNLKAVVGASAMWLKSAGNSYGTDQSRDDSKVSPYLGVVFDVTSNVSLYASYTNIYNPQVEVDSANRKLDPAQGSSVEAGIKSEWFDKRLYATAAVFRAKQKGLASFAGVFSDPNGPGQVGDSYYDAVDTTSKGFEVEVAGRVTDNWTLSGGYTYLELEDEAGQPTRTWIPTQTLKLATTYSLPALNDLKLGAQLRWQNAISYVDSNVQGYGVITGDVVLKQNSYAVVDLMAGVRLVDKVRATVNVRNVTNHQYLASLMWGQAFYAAPRSVSVSLSFAY